MITDFKEYTGCGLRNITYNGINSLTDLGILIADGSKVGDLTPRSNSTEIPLRQGNIDGSRVNGELFYEPRELVYRFKIFADSRNELKEKEAAAVAWLNSSGTYRITDSDYNGEWEFVNCVLKNITSEQGEVKAAEYLYLTAEFTCDPYMQAAGGTRSRVYKFTAQGGTSFHVLDNAYIFQPEWTATPVIAGNGVLINVPASGGSGIQYFTLTGIPEGAEITAASVQKGGESAGTVSVIGNDSGSLYLADTEATIALTYNEEVAPTSCAGGHRAANYSAAAPYTYRLKAYTEGTPTVKLNGTTLDLSQPFTLPDRALITIQNTGYGYYELWHDNTEVRL